MQWCFSRYELGPILHKPGSTNLTRSNGCIEVIIKLLNNLPLTFSVNDDGFFLEPIVSKIKVVNIHDNHIVALYAIYDEYCKLQELAND